MAKNQTADQIEESLVEFFETIRVAPIAMPTPGLGYGGAIYDSSAVKVYLATQLYWPNAWPQLARLLNALMEGDLKTVAKLQQEAAPQPPPPGSFIPQDQEARFGIKCSDVLDSDERTLADLLPFFERRHARSRFFGDAADESPARCAQWILPAKERYDGDFKVKTKTGLLVIGNTYDPATPLASAKNASETFEGSSLLHQEAYGVSTMSMSVHKHR